MDFWTCSVGRLYFAMRFQWAYSKNNDKDQLKDPVWTLCLKGAAKKHGKSGGSLRVVVIHVWANFTASTCTRQDRCGNECLATHLQASLWVYHDASHNVYLWHHSIKQGASCQAFTHGHVWHIYALRLRDLPPGRYTHRQMRNHRGSPKKWKHSSHIPLTGICTRIHSLGRNWFGH